MASYSKRLTSAHVNAMLSGDAVRALVTADHVKGIADSEYVNGLVSHPAPPDISGLYDLNRESWVFRGLAAEAELSAEDWPQEEGRKAHTFEVNTEAGSVFVYVQHVNTTGRAVIVGTTGIWVGDVHHIYTQGRKFVLSKVSGDGRAAKIRSIRRVG